MRYPIIASAVLLLAAPLQAAITQGEGAPEARTLPEEVQITIDRPVYQLREDMWDAEQHAYDIFNSLIDDRRFETTCGEATPTGSRVRSRLCQPHFVKVASQNHARDYVDYLRAERDPYDPNYRPAFAHQPREAVVAAQQREYREKIREVAEAHPEFREALVEYSELRRRYEAAAGRATE